MRGAVMDVACVGVFTKALNHSEIADIMNGCDYSEYEWLLTFNVIGFNLHGNVCTPASPLHTQDIDIYIYNHHHTSISMVV